MTSNEPVTVAAVPARIVWGALISSSPISMSRLDKPLDAGDSNQPPRSDLHRIKQTFSNKLPRFRETYCQGTARIADAAKLRFKCILHF